MSISSYLNTLHKKHNELDQQLHDAYLHRMSSAELAKIKKEKLKIKDQIMALSENNPIESKYAA